MGSQTARAVPAICVSKENLTACTLYRYSCDGPFVGRISIRTDSLEDCRQAAQVIPASRVLMIFFNENTNQNEREYFENCDLPPGTWFTLDQDHAGITLDTPTYKEYESYTYGAYDVADAENDIFAVCQTVIRCRWTWFVPFNTWHLYCYVDDDEDFSYEANYRGIVTYRVPPPP